MRTFITLAIFLASCLISLSSEIRHISDSWEFRQYRSDKEWLPAEIPGSVQADLLRLGLIEDPYFGLNDKTIQWIGEKSWEYRCNFNVSAEDLDNDIIYICFEGLDTYCDVYLNGNKIAETDNMFRKWNVDVKNILKEGQNSLYLYFNSAIKNDVMKYLDAPYRLHTWPNNDQSDITLSVYARKAGYHYGWDWGPRIVSCGIWRPVYLKMIRKAGIEDIHCTTVSINKNKAELSADISIESSKECDGKIELFLDRKKIMSENIPLKAGMNSFSRLIPVKNPELWWPNGMGEPKLYDLKCVLSVDGSEADKKDIKTGIRKVRFIRERDSLGTSFYFNINGKDVFLKGTNYIPQDHLYSRVTPDKYRDLLSTAAESNMNTIRVWGGGIYEEDLFYGLCDSLGLMVWQDMMFACGMFPSDSSFLENVEHEVKDNVRRLRNHPSIIIWNGNNENEVSYYAWGWRNKTPEKYRKEYETGMINLFHNTIPNAIYSMDTTRAYIPTSPVTGYNGIGMNHGDVHFWSVWKGADYEAYSSNVGRFMSEYGMQSYPEPATVRKYVNEKDLNMESPAMISHQRARHDETRDPYFGNKMIRNYIERYYGTPTDMNAEIMLSQAVQADAVKYAIESHRRAMPYCMGSLYWQLNDVWPGPSWSGIDYYGNWKALQYVVKKAFADILISPYTEDSTLKVALVSDMTEREGCTVVLNFYDNTGKFICRDSSSCVSIYPNSSKIAYSKSLKAIDSKAKIVHVSVIERSGTEIATNTLLLGRTKDLRLDGNIDVKINETGNGFCIGLQSKQFVKGVFLALNGQFGIFADNYFDIVPDKEYHIDVETEYSYDEFVELLSINCVSSLYY